MGAFVVHPRCAVWHAVALVSCLLEKPSTWWWFLRARKGTKDGRRTALVPTTLTDVAGKATLEQRYSSNAYQLSVTIFAG